ncbi:MAG TPA: hypothetical protein PLV45_18190, partial [bacterium]|nr:hypothetical protein [bacterium]
LWSHSRDADVTILRTDDGNHPLFGIYRRRCIPAIRARVAAGDRRVVSFWDTVEARIVDVGNDPYWKSRLFNINSPEDYAAARSRHRAV